MTRFRGALLLVVITALFQSTAGSALVKFDFEQKFFQDAPQPVLDHFMLEQDGVFHLFYLRGNPALSVGHAISTDLVHWTHEEPVLAPGSWDKYLWAPHLFRHPAANLWLMYYTGVNSVFAQQTGVAFSTDLYEWSKCPWPVYHPDPVWAQWDTTFWSHGRDPHVFEHDGQYYLFNTAKTWSNFGAVACAVSSDLINWTDIGPIFVHYTWHVLESIFVMERNNKFHMFFTEEAVNNTSHMWSDSLLSGWDIVTNRRIIDTGHAPQVSFLSDGTEIFSRHAIYNDNNGVQTYTIRLDTLRWVGDIPAPWKPWGLARDWTAVSGAAFAFQPTFGNNPYARGEDVESTFEGKCWIGTKERYTGPIGVGVPGSYQGETPVGVLRSRTFTLGGYSINLLVGGTDDIDSCYVAAVDAATGTILAKETGKGVEEMDRRYMNLFGHTGKNIYIEIVDLSETGHINVDDIIESAERVDAPYGDGRTNKKPGLTLSGEQLVKIAETLRNTPNPFNPSTTISFELTSAATAVLEVFDVNGRLVRRLINQDLPAGAHSARWNGVDGQGRSVASGVYFYRLVVDGRAVATRKMALLK